MNRAGLNMIEAESLDQVKGLCVYPLISEDYREAFKALAEEVFKGESKDLEFRMIGLKGHPVWLYTRAVPLRNEKGEIVSALATTIDITERKEAEEKLCESEQFIRNMLDTVDEGFVVIDRNFRILNANRAYCRLHDGSCDEVIGRYCYEIAHKIQRPCHEEGEECSVRRVFDTGEPCAVAHRHVDATGDLMYVETKAFPIKDSSGTVSSVIETINNITERHLLEEERLKTQKLEAIGTLAGGIAHDFNNLLQGIFGFISMAKLTYDQKENSLAMLEQAEKALHQSVNLTTQLLTFSKGGKPVKRRMQLQPVIENAVKFALSGSKAGYRIIVAEDLWAVEADEGQIGQVIQNIVLNAEQAMPEGGTIVLTARNVEQQAAHDKLLGPGKHVEVSISDTGIGIPEKYLQKIFDPYFTTKEMGSGLGLATSYSIIRNHGGVIAVESEVGRGTTFYVYLPAVEAAEGIQKEPAAVPFTGKGNILVMDDEEIVLNITGEMIRALGHDVDFANHGQSAIEKYRAALESGKPYDIVILDLTIRGGMGGRETVQRILEMDPAVIAIVSSGYSDDAVISEYYKYGFKARLSKPYRLEDLRNTLHALLNG